MKISRLSLIFLLLNIFITPLLGKYNLFGLEFLNKLIYFILPLIYFISFIIDTCKYNYLKNHLKPRTLSLLIIIFIITMIISMIFSINLNFNSMTNFIMYIYLVSFIYTIYVYKFDKEQLITIFKTIVSVLVIIIILGILQYIFKFDLVINGIYKYPGAIGRITSTLSNSTIVDKYLTFNLLLLMYVVYKLKKFNWKLAVIMFLGTIALAFTFSRTGTLCFYIVSLIFLTIYLLKKQIKNAILIVILITTLYLIPGQNYLLSSTASYVKDEANEILDKIKIDFLTNTFNKIADIFIIGESNKSDASIDSRDQYLKIAQSIVKEYPFTGIGIGNYNYIYKHQNVNHYLKNDLEINFKYLYPHNQYYHFAAEAGVFSLIILLLILTFILIKSIKNNNLIISTLFFLVFILSCTTESLLYIKDISIWFTIVYSIFMKNEEKRV